MQKIAIILILLVIFFNIQMLAQEGSNQENLWNNDSIDQYNKISLKYDNASNFQ